MFRSRLLLFLIVTLLQMTGCGVNIHCILSPTITGQPSSQTIAVGERAIFTVAATGTAPMSYQWLKNGVAIPGATRASYLTPVVTPADSGSSFAVTLSNSIGTLTSSSAFLTVNSSAVGNVRFVAPNGSDSNPGTIDQPYKTIQYCATTVTAGSTCEVRAGTYRETVNPNSGITITSYNFETVIVDGSDPITGWSPYQGSIYEVSVSLSADDTNQIFVGSEMMTEARWPNGDDLFHVNWATAQAGTNSGQIVDPKLPAVNWTSAKIHLWSGTNPFGNQTGSVTASSPGRISIDVGQTSTCPSICPTAGGYYYLFGTLGALDAEREWFYDVASKALYFMAPGGVDPNTIDVRAKQRQYAFDLRGKVRVTVRNIAIFASTIATDKSSANNTLDRINAQYVSHFTSLPTASTDPTGSNFSILFVHLGDSGIIVNGTGNTLQNSTITFSAGSGIALEGSNNTIKNNLIYNVDYIGDYASGIVLDGNSNTVQYNTIHDTGRQAIYFNDGVTNQDVGYNDLFNSMMLTRDGAEIYACCEQTGSGTRIHHNWIHDTQSLIKGPGDLSALSGVYFDNGSGGFNVDQNVLWKNQRTNILINGDSDNGSKNINLQNNTIPDSSYEGVISITSVHDCTSTRVVDNRIFVDLNTTKDDMACVISNNGSSAPGATEMSPPPQVGCNFFGCSSGGPPAILDGSISPCPASSFAQP